MSYFGKLPSGVGPTFAGALLIAATAAGGAQAVTISPDDTEITGTADNPTWNYGTRVWTCDTGTIVGTTGTDSATVDVDIEFQEPCNLSGANATFDCADGEFTRLRALTADTNQGEVDELLPGFECALTVLPNVCTMTVGAQDLSANNDADLLNEGSTVGETIQARVSVFVTVTRSGACGPASGTGGLSADYLLDTPVTFDP